MTPTDLRNFFVASAGVAGALIGLLFVAISVAHERLTADDAEQSHQIRASAALTSFTNSVTISLFALVPGVGLGDTAWIVGGLGLLFIVASLLSVWRVRASQPRAPRDVLFLAGLGVTFGLQLVFGLMLALHAHDAGPANSIAVLVIVCFLIGIARSWELIGGPSIGILTELSAALRARGGEDHEPPA